MALNERDLLFSVRREPVANRIVFQVAHDVFDNWFRVEEVADKPDPKFDDEVQRVLGELDAKAVFTEMAVYERLFGWAIIALTYLDYGKDPAKPVVNPKGICELLPLSSLHVTVQSADEDKDLDSSRYGLPVLYTVTVKNSCEQLKIHFSRVIHCATRLLEHPYKGMSVLEPVYDDLTVLRNIRWGLGQTIFRYGSGFPDVEVQDATNSDLDKIEAGRQFKNLQARTYFLHNQKTKLEFKGVAGRALNPEPYYVPIMENISAGCGIPLAILRGAQAGALTGSEINEREYFKLISDAQSRYEPAIYRLIHALIECGQIRFKYGKRRDYRIVWLGGFELSDRDKAAVELQRAQARRLKTFWKTVDEIRSEEMLDPLPESSGDVVLGLEKTQDYSGAFSGSAVAEADSNLFSRFTSWLHRKKGGKGEVEKNQG
jgi:phage-related protein (TIGR01555 family)